MSDSGRYIGQKDDETWEKILLQNEIERLKDRVKTLEAAKNTVIGLLNAVTDRAERLETALLKIKARCRPDGIMTGELWHVCEEALKGEPGGSVEIGLAQGASSTAASGGADGPPQRTG